MTSFYIIAAALVIDRLFGEPKKYHPLVGFGQLANNIERQFNTPDQQPNVQRIKGLFSLIILISPILLGTIFLSALGEYFSVLILTLCIGWQSLKEHGLAVYHALLKNDIYLAQQRVSYMVSRDVHNLSPDDMSKACIESILENGSDAVFSALFWFLIAGAPGVILYRMINTLDAMWGYKTPRFLYFGWSAARLDDLMNYIPAQLTALSYFLVSRNPQALYCWRTQGNSWKSPNAGPVMASGAGSLGVILGGYAIYNGVKQYRPILGVGKPAKPIHINKSLTLISYSIYLWLATLFLYNCSVY